MIEIGNHPDSPTALILHSQESGRFMPCTRTEVEALVVAAKAGLLDPFLAGTDGGSVIADPAWVGFGGDRTARQ